MNVMESFKMAVGNIRTSKMRSFLTMLGIIIGVAAVIVIVGLGNGMEIYMTEQFESMGTNTLTVSIYGRGTGRTVTDEDMYDIVERNSDALELLSPTVTMQSPAKIGTDTINSHGPGAAICGYAQAQPCLRGGYLSQSRVFRRQRSGPDRQNRRHPFYGGGRPE